MRKTRILMLMGGPKYDLAWEFGSRLRKMSAFSCGDLMTSSSSAEELELGDFTVHPILSEGRKRLAMRLSYILASFRLLRRARREGRPVELIITYDPMASGLPGLLLAKLFGARLVCEVNGDYSAWENYSHIASPFRKKLKRWMLMATARFVLRRADAIKYLFPGQLDLLDVHPKSAQITEQFGDYVMVDSFSNMEQEKVILLVGFPLQVKGGDIAIEAFKKIAHDYPDWRLKIMGHFPDRSEIDGLIDSHPQIVVQRPVLHRQINEHIGRCGIFLLPSRTEGLPRVLVEALAAGKPVIASRINGIPLVFDDGVEGFLVAPNNADEVADALSRLMSDASLRNKMSVAAMTRARSHFSETAYFDKLQKLYSRILSV